MNTHCDEPGAQTPPTMTGGDREGVKTAAFALTEDDAPGQEPVTLRQNHMLQLSLENIL